MTQVLTFALLGFQRIKFSYSSIMRGLEYSVSNLMLICALAKILINFINMQGKREEIKTATVKLILAFHTF